MKNLCFTVLFSSLAVVLGVGFHRYLPGVGVVVMPMVWPLVVLSSLVPLHWAFCAAFAVPFVSAALSGMPVAPLFVAFKFMALVALVSMLLAHRLTVATRPEK